MREMDVPLYAALAARLRASGLARVMGDVLALARPAVSLGLARVDEGAIAVGASKVGGAADLPPGVAWPEWRGLPLPFIAQVRLEEVAPLDPEGDLPHHGLLSFFYAINDPDGGLRLEDDPAAWRVLYRADPTTLERRPIPAALVGKLDTIFRACTVTPTRRLTLPADANKVAAALGCTNDERLALIGIVGGELDTSFDDEMDHRLLGYPYTLNGSDSFLAAYLARNGIEHPEPPRENEQTLEQRQRQQRAMAALEAAAREWRPPAGGYQTLDDIWRAMADFQTRVDMGPLLDAVSDLEPTPPATDFQARMAALREAAEREWRLLLQVYSNSEAEMDWAGGGVIHFGIA
ncbi:MAG TPA: YwqG family protein, partial [Ktedonobacterales bacterium]